LCLGGNGIFFDDKMNELTQFDNYDDYNDVDKNSNAWKTPRLGRRQHLESTTTTPTPTKKQ
jgi:hypothetical protein